MSYLVSFVLVFFSPFSIAITRLGKRRLSVFRTFVRFALVWFYLFSLPLGVWEGLRFVIVVLPGTPCDCGTVLPFYLYIPPDHIFNESIEPLLLRL